MPPLYKYTKSEILLDAPTFQTKVTPLATTTHRATLSTHRTVPTRA